ncbi:unnamed protein product [Hyaloperonospora brassicae]|uniref:DUF1764-domain-containing protein n=1 Tax=Hyaloperonospora brassicae TaxID=162125 RepID=A0AAV0UVI4_HYABA|nr:unnamed protein product [Hyaloperonospora brassicae]
MASKKRSRAQAASGIDEQPPASVQLQSEQKKTKTKKKKATFSRTLSSEAGLEPSFANDAKSKATTAPVTGKGAFVNVAAAGAAATHKSVTKQTKGSEVDELFTLLKTEKKKKSAEDERQKLAAVEAERHEMKAKERLRQQIKKLEAQNTNSTAVGLNPDPRPVRYDENGLPIYTESSLQIGTGGNSKDCPFDCWCCF